VKGLPSREYESVIDAVRLSAVSTHVAAGGLISYGTNIRECLPAASICAGRILKGEKPANPAGAGTDQV
jgi:hypothetical protein